MAFANIKFECDGKTRGVALFNGIKPDELQHVLKNMFNLVDDVIGFIGEVINRFSFVKYSQFKWIILG